MREKFFSGGERPQRFRRSFHAVSTTPGLAQRTTPPRPRATDSLAGKVQGSSRPPLLQADELLSNRRHYESRTSGGQNDALQSQRSAPPQSRSCTGLSKTPVERPPARRYNLSFAQRFAIL